MNETSKESKVFIPGSKKNVVPFMRDVFTIPTSSRLKPNLIGSMCPECEEYFFPKTGQKATCDNPFCPRSTKETLLSGKGRILSATVTRSSVEGEDERASAVIMLEEGIKINSPLVDWDGYQFLLVPGTPVELVLQEMGETDDGNVVVGYAFRLVTGRKKPQFPSDEKEEEKSAPERKKPAPAKVKPEGAKPKAVTEELEKPAKKVAKKKAAKEKVAKKKPLKKKVKKAPAKKKPLKKKVATKKKPKKDIRGKKKVVKKKAKKKTAVKAKKKVAKKKSLKKKSPSKKAASKKITRRPKAKKR